MGTQIKVFRDPLESDWHIIHWQGKKKTGELVVSQREMLEDIICEGCAVYRLKKVSVNRDSFSRMLKEMGAREYLQCPECGGEMEEECHCGKVPHRVGCPAGIKNYFPDDFIGKKVMRFQRS